MCELSVDHCDFFTTDMGKCHLGRYNHSYLGEVVGSNVAMTYHNQGNKKLGINSKIFFKLCLFITYLDKIEWVKEDNFRWWSSGNYWYKW